MGWSEDERALSEITDAKREACTPIMLAGEDHKSRSTALHLSPSKGVS